MALGSFPVPYVRLSCLTQHPVRQAFLPDFFPILTQS